MEEETEEEDRTLETEDFQEYSDYIFVENMCKADRSALCTMEQVRQFHSSHLEQTLAQPNPSHPPWKKASHRLGLGMCVAPLCAVPLFLVASAFTN